MSPKDEEEEEDVGEHEGGAKLPSLDLADFREVFVQRTIEDPRTTMIIGRKTINP